MGILIGGMEKFNTFWKILQTWSYKVKIEILKTLLLEKEEELILLIKEVSIEVFIK